MLLLCYPTALALEPLWCCSVTPLPLLWNPSDVALEPTALTFTAFVLETFCPCSWTPLPLFFNSHCLCSGTPLPLLWNPLPFLLTYCLSPVLLLIRSVHLTVFFHLYMSHHSLLLLQDLCFVNCVPVSFKVCFSTKFSTFFSYQLLSFYLPSLHHWNCQ